MERYIIEQRVFIIESLAAIVGKFRTKYGRNNDLTSSTLPRVFEKFKQTGPIGDTKYSVRPKNKRFKCQSRNSA